MLGNSMYKVREASLCNSTPQYGTENLSFSIKHITDVLLFAEQCSEVMNVLVGEFSE